jgi:mRNA deadenylase 3'-5' endonuclease subunit Ccr4
VSFLLLNIAVVRVHSLVPQVSLVTWNLLAPHFASPLKYPWAAMDDLDWSVRESRIVRELMDIDADIICLQEVQVDLWDHLLSQFSGTYQGTLQKMERNHPVANAILVRRGLKITRTESRSRALIAVLMDEEELSSPLYLVNVHLEAGYSDEADAIRFHQVRSLRKRLFHQVNKDAATVDNSPPIVITGDCNMLRGTPLYSFLQSGTGEPLNDAYLEQPPPWGPDVRMTYRSGHLLDYVWVSDSVHVLRTMPVKEAVASMEQKAWPSAENPSDHIPIGAILSWPGAPTLVNSTRSQWQQLKSSIR